MFLNFEKWQGCQNDFIVYWLTDTDGDIVLDSIKRQTPKLCHRRLGIGADGILVLHVRKRDDLYPYQLTIINSDGSIAKNCGNGLRCAAMSVKRRITREQDDTPEMLELPISGTDLEPKICRFIGRNNIVAIEMGYISLNEDVSWWVKAKPSLQAIDPQLANEFGIAEIGNPHLVVYTEQASRELLLKVGPALQDAPCPGGLNVHIVKPLALGAKDFARAEKDLSQEVEEGFTAWVYERGAGETMACGSGACAVAALQLGSGLCARDKWVVVDMPGGRLYVKHEAKNAPVLLAGPATFVFEGVSEI